MSKILSKIYIVPIISPPGSDERLLETGQVSPRLERGPPQPGFKYELT